MTTFLRFSERLPEITMPSGEVLLPEGERTGLLYILVAGEVGIFKGNAQFETVSEPGAIFGEISALIDIPHMATVKALTEVRVVRIDNAALFLANNSDAAIDVARLLAERLNNVVGYLADLKEQFEGRDHMSMVDEVLETLVNQQRSSFTPGSNRDPDPMR